MKLKMKAKWKHKIKLFTAVEEPKGFKFRFYVEAVKVWYNERGDLNVGLSWYIIAPNIPIFIRLGEVIANRYRDRLAYRFFIRHN